MAQYDPELQERVRRELLATFESLGRKIRGRETPVDYVFVNYQALAGRIMALNARPDEAKQGMVRGL